MRDAGLVGRIERVEGGQLWMGSVGVVGWWRRAERVWLRYWRRGGVEGIMVVGLGMRGEEGEGDVAGSVRGYVCVWYLMVGYHCARRFRFGRRNHL